MNEMQQAELNVFNMMGQQVLTLHKGKLNAGAHRFSLDTSGLSNGIYYLKLDAADKKYIYKLIVTR
jgi:hypothetical protein